MSLYVIVNARYREQYGIYFPSFDFCINIFRAIRRGKYIEKSERAKIYSILYEVSSELTILSLARKIYQNKTKGQSYCFS